MEAGICLTFSLPVTPLPPLLLNLFSFSSLSILHLGYVLVTKRIIVANRNKFDLVQIFYHSFSNVPISPANFLYMDGLYFDVHIKCLQAPDFFNEASIIEAVLKRGVCVIVPSRTSYFSFAFCFLHFEYHYGSWSFYSTYFNQSCYYFVVFCCTNYSKFDQQEPLHIDS